MTELADLAAEAARVLDEARYITRATDDDAAWSQVGSVAGNYLPRIVELATDPQPSPPPDPPPSPVVRLVPPGGTKAFQLAGTTITVRCPNRTTPCAVALTLNGGALQSDQPVPQIVDADLVGLGFVEVEATYNYSSMASAYASVLTALQWVYAHTEAIGGDRARVHGVGHSTGGSLVALLGLRSDSPGFTGSMYLWSTAATTGNPLGAGPEQQMVSQKYGQPPDQWFPSNWLNDAKQRSAHIRVYQVHATDDSLVPYAEAAAFATHGQQTFGADAWHFAKTTGGHGATAAPLCQQAQADLQAADRS